MPSSYTPLLRLTLPADGELVGTWGQTVNNGITTLEEAAIAGTVAVAMADANQTLTTVNGATDQARYNTIRCTGALTAQRNLVCPAVSKNYFVRNATTGGFGVQFKTSAGTGIVVPANTAMLLYCDGTNVVQAVDALSSVTSLTVAGASTFNGVVVFNEDVAFNNPVTVLAPHQLTVETQINCDTLNCTDDAIFGSLTTFLGEATFDITHFTDQMTIDSVVAYQSTSRAVPAGIFLQQNTYNQAAFTSTTFASLFTATSTIASRLLGGAISPVPFTGYMKISGSILVQNNSVTAGVFTLRMAVNGTDFAPDFAYYCNAGGGGGALQSGYFGLVFAVTAGDTIDIKGKVAAGMNVDYYIYGALFEMYSVF